MYAEDTTMKALQDGSIVASGFSGEEDPRSFYIDSFVNTISMWDAGLGIQSTSVSTMMVTKNPSETVLSQLLETYQSSTAPYVCPSTVHISVSVEIQSLNEVNAKEGTFAFAGWLHSSWLDTRLTYSKQDIHWENWIAIPPGMVWDPYVTILGVPSSMKAVPSTAGGVQMKIMPGGIVQKSTWVSATIPCAMDLAQYPADTQHCLLEVFSPTGVQTIVDPVGTNTISTPFFENMDSGQFKRFISYKDNIATQRAMLMSSAMMAIDFERKTSVHILNTILPAIMLVLTAFGQFWIAAVPARAAIAIISFLVMYNLKGTVSQNLPNSGSLTWLENFLIMNITFLWVCIGITILSTQAGLKYKTPDEDANKEVQSAPEQKQQDADHCTIAAYFKRYDLDENGTINTPDELSQLTINLVSAACGIRASRGDMVNMQDLEMAIAEASKTIEVEPLSIEDYTRWYFERISAFSTSIDVASSNIIKTDTATSSSEWIWKQMLCILFPTSASNWPDRFAQVWVPVLYCVALIACFSAW